MKYCIFVERAWDDEKFKLLKEFVAKKIESSDLFDLDMLHGHTLNTDKVKLFVVTPVNYDLAVAEQGYSGTKKQFEKILKERYQELYWMGCNLELHLHLAMVLDNFNQEKMFKEATSWMRDNGFKPELVTFGWYIYNKESLRLAKKYGLKVFKDNWHYSFHCYELPRIFSLIMILQNIRGWFR